MAEGEKIPLSIILFIVYVCICIIGIVVSFFSNQMFLGPYDIKGAGAFLLEAIMFVLLIFILYGTYKRKSWARKLAIIYFVCSTALIVIDMAFFFTDSAVHDEYVNMVKEKMPPGSPGSSPGAMAMLESTMYFTYALTVIMSVAVLILIVWLMMKRKDYFSNP